MSEDIFSNEDLTENKREEILKIQDISKIGADEHLVFLDYAIANIHTLMRTQIKVKIPDKSELEDMA